MFRREIKIDFNVEVLKDYHRFASMQFVGFCYNTISVNVARFKITLSVPLALEARQTHIGNRFYGRMRSAANFKRECEP